ncbi:zinc-binding dehydrogenase [Microlunatus elymi]|uniref:Zinc-binding dehydrogenase n=1 Tax=Microlunatus elymi TaxID=2596828 RepID=A0A516Q294_9ACTN|nr:alcohol dehydrogenase catalytic domain-containing protein [Microlunatus elymi]QDP97492.1 zinc-binding dehydrogenase [Microlunatus elymi]
MRAVTWQGHRHVAVENVADPKLVEDDDVIISVTSAAICGSDLHLYEVLGPFMHRGDILGHEAIGVVQEAGPAVRELAVGDRVVVPFNICCGHCYMCRRGLQSQCETTQVREHGSGAALFGYSELYGSVPGAQAELLRVPFANYGPIKITDDRPDERYLYLSDILPTAWQAVAYADPEPGSTVVVIGLGPVGQLCARIAAGKGHRVIAVDPIDYRREIASEHGIESIDLDQQTVETIMDATEGRGADASIDAVGMEAHGSPAKVAQRAAGMLPDTVARKLMTNAGVDALGALSLALQTARRGGTVSLAGVYGGMTDPLPMMQMFDRQLQLRMGQCNVRHWIDELMPLVDDAEDPLGLESLATHRLPLVAAPDAYRMFQRKEDNCLKIILHPQR